MSIYSVQCPREQHHLMILCMQVFTLPNLMNVYRMNYSTVIFFFFTCNIHPSIHTLGHTCLHLGSTQYLPTCRYTFINLKWKRETIPMLKRGAKSQGWMSTPPRNKIGQDKASMDLPQGKKFIAGIRYLHGDIRSTGIYTQYIHIYKHTSIDICLHTYLYTYI